MAGRKGDRTGRSTPRGAGLGAVLLLAAVAAVSHADERLNELLDSGALEGVANPVPVNYLLNEGRGRLDAELEAVARDQLTAALRVQTSPMVAMLAGVQGGLNAPTMKGIRERTAKQASGAGLLKLTVGAMLVSGEWPAAATAQARSQSPATIERE